MFTELFAICLLVADFEKSLAFYRDKLELQVANANGKFADFQINGTSLAIFQRDEATQMFPAKYMHAGGGNVLAFQVKDIEQACKELR